MGIACDEAVRSLADMAREAIRVEHAVSCNRRIAIEVRDGSGLVVEVGVTFEVIRRRPENCGTPAGVTG